MWPHFVNLLAASWSKVLLALGTTTLAVILFSLAVPVATFIVTMAVVWKSQGGVMTHLKQSAVPTLIGFSVPFVLIAFVFAWSIVRNIYDDHEWSVVKIGSASHEIETLTSNLKDTQQKLVGAEKRKPLPKDRCVWKSYAMRPPRDVKGAMSTSETWIVCSYDLMPPYSIDIEYNELPFSFVMPPNFPPSVNVGVPLMLTRDKEWKMIVNSSPPLPAWSVLMFSAYGKNSQPPAVLSVTINSANRNTLPSGGVVLH